MARYEPPSQDLGGTWLSLARRVALAVIDQAWHALAGVGHYLGGPVLPVSSACRIPHGQPGYERGPGRLGLVGQTCHYSRNGLGGRSCGPERDHRYQTIRAWGKGSSTMDPD